MTLVTAHIDSAGVNEHRKTEYGISFKVTFWVLKQLIMTDGWQYQTLTAEK